MADEPSAQQHGTKRSGSEELDTKAPKKQMKEFTDVEMHALLLEQPKSVEEKDLLIIKLKSALNSWLDAFSDSSNNDPASIKNELTSVRAIKQQLAEAKKRESSLFMRLSTKEQEILDLQTQVSDLRKSISPHTRQLVGTLLDPAVNSYIQKLQNDLKNTEKKLKQCQDDLDAQKFTPHSITGKKLMAKCRALQEENEELGRQISEGQLQKLTLEAALQREYAEELKSSLAESNGFVLQLDEEIEMMQATILTLQQQLKKYKEKESQQPTAAPTDEQ
jgi:chromosome segregation ATPase